MLSYPPMPHKRCSPMRCVCLMIFCCSLLWPLLAVKAQSPVSTPPTIDSQALEADLLATMQAEGIAGVTVLVQEGDTILYEAGLGMAADGEPMNPEGRYVLGRSAEPFLTTLTFLQAERGLLAPDSTVTSLIPSFTLPERPNATAALTLQRLLTHTGGLGRDDLAPFNPLPLADFPTSQGDFFPGVRFSYCTRCTDLLLHTLEAQANRPIADLLTDLIFYPLHMDMTAIEGGQLVTTPQDLSHFVAIQLQGGRWQGVQLLKPETILAMQRPDAPTQRFGREFYGEGWFVTVDNGFPVSDDKPQLDHLITARDVGNYQAQITLVPAYQRAVILLTDQPTNGLDGLMAVALRHVAAWSPPADLKPEAPSTLAGAFRPEEGSSGNLILSAEGNDLIVEYEGQRGVAELIDLRAYAVQLGGEWWYFYLSETGRARGLVLTHHWVTIPFLRQN